MTTNERLERVETELARAKRHNRWLLGGAALCLGIGLFALALGPRQLLAQARADAAKEVRAGRFVVEDENGKPRAILGMPGDEGGRYTTLALLDENGTQRVVLGTAKDHSGLTLYHEKGTQCIALSVFKDGPKLSLFDQNDKSSAVLGADKDGTFLRLWDQKGKVTWQAP